MPKPSRKHMLILLVVGLVIFTVHLDELYVNIMEARNFITAREMVNLDHWVLTTLNGEARYEKPPLPTWLTALSGMALGFDSLFALRLPAALVSLFMLYFFYSLLLRLELKKKQSFLASLILSTSFYIVFAGRNGQWDIFTHGFMVGALYYLFKFFSQAQAGYRTALLGGLFFGASFLSKGPVSLYALFLPFLIAYSVVYDYPGFKQKQKAFVIFLLTGLVMGGWWFVYVRLADPVAFLEITTRETTRWASYNVRPFYYYWNFFIQSGIWTLPALISLLYPYLKGRVSNLRAYRFSLLWTLSAVLLLSLIPEKKSRYLLPVMIPLALNTSFYVEYLFRKFRDLPRWEKGLVYFQFGIIGLIGLIYPAGVYWFLGGVGLELWYLLSALALFSLGVGIFYFLKKQVFPKVFYLTVGFIVAIIAFAFPLSRVLLNNPAYKNVSELQEKQIPIYQYRIMTPEITWAYGEPIPTLDQEELKTLNEDRFGLLLMEKDTLVLSELQHLEVISSERYDLNPVHPEKRGYKDRLVRKFYVLDRKE